jgi:hypothetical protein
MPTLARKSDMPLPYGQQTPRLLANWWGVASVAFGALAAAFLPAAYFSGGDWASLLYNIFPAWSLCALIGVACGIRGMMGKRLTRAQRLLAATGTILSMAAFLVLTLLALMGGT